MTKRKFLYAEIEWLTVRQNKKQALRSVFQENVKIRKKMKSIILIHLQSAYREKERSRIQIPMRALINLQSPFQTLLNYFLVFFTSMAYLLFLNTSIVFKFGIHLYFFSLFSNRIWDNLTCRFQVCIMPICHYKVEFQALCSSGDWKSKCSMFPNISKSMLWFLCSCQPLIWLNRLNERKKDKLRIWTRRN